MEVMKLDDYDQVCEYIECATKAGWGEIAHHPEGDRREGPRWIRDSGQFQATWKSQSFLHRRGAPGPKPSAMSMMRTRPKKACSRALGQVMSPLGQPRVRHQYSFGGNGDGIFSDLRAPRRCATSTPRTRRCVSNEAACRRAPQHRFRCAQPVARFEETRMATPLTKGRASVSPAMPYGLLCAGQGEGRKGTKPSEITQSSPRSAAAARLTTASTTAAQASLRRRRSTLRRSTPR